MKELVYLRVSESKWIGSARMTSPSFCNWVYVSIHNQDVREQRTVDVCFAFGE